MYLLHTIKTRSKHRERRLTDNMQTAQVTTPGPLLSMLCGSRESPKNTFRIAVLNVPQDPAVSICRHFPDVQFVVKEVVSQGRVH